MKFQEVSSHKAIIDAVKDFKPNGRLTLQGVEVQVTRQGMVEVDNLLHKYVDALVLETAFHCSPSKQCLTLSCCLHLIQCHS